MHNFIAVSYMRMTAARYYNRRVRKSLRGRDVMQSSDLESFIIYNVLQHLLLHKHSVPKKPKFTSKLSVIPARAHISRESRFGPSWGTCHVGCK